METTPQFVILPDEPIATISPLLHGHFAEHLGELIYPGICVPRDSSIPNTGGIRHDVVEALKPLGIPVLRWPGGCFADDYHWRDGVGPVKNRPKRINVHWGMADESNHFGTHEFIALCNMIGAEPYFAANLGSGTPREMQEWIEYCNFAGDSALANERRANGADEPFRVGYWGIGNENWGCGGNMTPAQYAGEYKKFQTFAFNYPGAPIEKVACGPNGPDWNWTEGVFDALTGNCKCDSGSLRMVHGFSAHYYAGAAGTATEYTEQQWLELLSKAAAVEGVVTGHRAIMDEYDPERKVKLYLDEWGAWHPVEKGKPGSGLYQQNTIRDACLAAITLDIFHNHADKLFMANIAQVINVLQSILLVDDDRCIKTPTYHVFDLYQPHKGAQAVRSIAPSDTVSKGEASETACQTCYRDKRFPGLRRVTGSASLIGKTICVTLVNADPTRPSEIEVVVRGSSLGNVEIKALSTADIHDHNTFAEPDKVLPGRPQRIDASGSTITVTLPPASITRIRGELI
jgi:alpha-N-arabinofuranosidase